MYSQAGRHTVSAVDHTLGKAGRVVVDLDMLERRRHGAAERRAKAAVEDERRIVPARDDLVRRKNKAPAREDATFSLTAPQLALVSLSLSLSLFLKTL